MPYFCLEKTITQLKKLVEIQSINNTDKKCKVDTREFYKLRLNCSVLVEDMKELRKLTK